MADNTAVIALITAGSALAGVAISTAAQFILSNQAHKHAVEDDKHARIGRYFAKIYSAAYVYLTYAREIRLQLTSYKPPQNQLEQSNPIYSEIHKADTEAQEAIAMLALEGGNDEIIDAYMKVKGAYTLYITRNEDDNTELTESYQKLLIMMQGKYRNLENVASPTGAPVIIRRKTVRGSTFD